MLESNEQKVLSLIHPGEIVLDIGGWGRPFNRANWVIDAEPFDTRGYYGPSRPAQGGEREYFTQDTWIRRDICEKTPFPFKDKEIDFVICSHTLEDIRDPLWVCTRWFGSPSAAIWRFRHDCPKAAEGRNAGWLAGRIIAG